MIEQLRVRSLGVIDDVDVSFGPGLSVITGETGAGKTLIVEALELLVGGKSDPALVRFEATEAIIEGRFVVGDADTIVSRGVPATGRTKASIDDRMVTLAALEEFGRSQVDLYGQHSHQSLLRAQAQRHALDLFGEVDLSPLRALRQRLTELDARLATLGGDDSTRLRELDLLRFELSEIEAAQITARDEDEQLAREAARLSQASALRAACEGAYIALEGGEERGAVDLIGAALNATSHHEDLAGINATLRTLAGAVADAASDLRRMAEMFDEDPARLEVVGERRQLLHRLVRKYGSSLDDVLIAAHERETRIETLADSDERRAAIDIERTKIREDLLAAETAVGDARRQAASRLAAEVTDNLRALALASASLAIAVGEGVGDDVEFLLSANRGEPELPLSRDASGGELARVMLALRLVLSDAPPTMIFDEVDAGIGGETALVVGRALAALGKQHQVLVVTHLAQVAAFADHQFVVEKEERDGRTISRCSRVEGEERIRELSRMLSGHPDSSAARRHAAELLQQAVV